ncbi:hypothetical protein RND71_032657 [Anisodus tanguticus]|uniref:Uncharacterized protein n=1 Tax=Anisodus tanguticus TaxID=243964 RepID=A0AAE1R788_9SOLA|nr:hypothetical protein RND71_032657 [Anisodus tanguticus]
MPSYPCTKPCWYRIIKEGNSALIVSRRRQLTRKEYDSDESREEQVCCGLGSMIQLQ